MKELNFTVKRDENGNVTIEVPTPKRNTKPYWCFKLYGVGEHIILENLDEKDNLSDYDLIIKKGDHRPVLNNSRLNLTTAMLAGRTLLIVWSLKTPWARVINLSRFGQDFEINRDEITEYGVSFFEYLEAMMLNKVKGGSPYGL